MRSEHQKNLGHLTEKNLEAKSLKLKIEALRDSIRDVLDPIEEVEDLEVEKMMALASELAEAYTDYIEILGKIKNVKKMLGH